MNFSIIFIITFWYLAGICNGFMDAIKYHNAYKHWGPFWSKDSWKRLYDGDINWFEKIFDAAFDAWHLLKYIMMSLLAVSLCLAFLIKLTVFQSMLISSLAIISFTIGFKTTYK